MPSFLAAIIISVWFVTWGDWNLFAPEDFCGFYDAQARSLFAGQFDVPAASIGSESFSFQGKTYGYFGIAPALLRIPLVLLFKSMDGRWSRLMMLVAATLNVICAYRILRIVCSDQAASTRNQRLIHSLFILCVGIGSTNVFLVARSFTFHEAIMWGSSFALLFTCTILSYFARPNKMVLVLAGLLAFMSFHSRATVGTGPLIVMMAVGAILIWRACGNPKAFESMLGFGPTSNPRSHAFIAGAAVTIILISYFGVNYARFHTLDGVPLEYYDFYVQNPRYLEITGGRQLHLENVPTALASYLGFHGLWLGPKFPWLFPSREATFIGSPSIILVEGFSTFPVSMPALFALAFLGCAPLLCSNDANVRRLRLPAIALFLGGGIVLATVALTERYLHDFYPVLIICAAIGISRVEHHKYLRSATIVIALLAAASIAINCSFALENQRLDAWRDRKSVV